MAEETTLNSETKEPGDSAVPEQETQTAPKAKAAKVKAPAIEDKPFGEFIEQHFIPALKEALAKQGIKDAELKFTKEQMPFKGIASQDACWQLLGNFNGGRRQFNIYFLEEDINGKKAFSWAVNGSKPSTIESFMIDERKITLDLLVLYTLQRLNGQKWLARN